MSVGKHWCAFMYTVRACVHAYSTRAVRGLGRALQNRGCLNGDFCLLLLLFSTVLIFYKYEHIFLQEKKNAITVIKMWYEKLQ